MNGDQVGLSNTTATNGDNLVQMQVTVVNVPISTTQMVLTRALVSGGPNQVRSSIINDTLYCTVTESTDTHNTKNANIIRG